MRLGQGEAAVGQGLPQQLRLCSQKRGGFWGGRMGFPKMTADVERTERNNAIFDHWLAGETIVGIAKSVQLESKSGGTRCLLS